MEEMMDIERQNKESQIQTLISRLQAPTSDIGDWKIVKCYEAKLQNKEMPYDLDTLLAQRQAVRDEINRLQAEL
jgi:hypothetical protein